MSNRIVTRYASLLLAAFVIGCQDDGPTGVDTLPFETSPRAVGIIEGSSSQLTVTGIAAGDVVWETSDPAIATVSATGRVTGVAPGFAAISARSKNDNALISSTSVQIISLPTLTFGTAQTNLSGATGTQRLFKVIVPAGTASVTITMSGGTGDADLYTRAGAIPTFDLFDCRPFAAGNNEVCTYTNPAAGTIFIMIDAYEGYTGVRLLATKTP